MEKGTEKYIETIEYLGKLYDFCNERLFGGELQRPVITVQRDERNKAFGWWSVNKVWKASAEDEGEHELNITAQQLDRPLGAIAATMIHEMCHQFASVNKIPDTSRGGNYHNKQFKFVAEQHGLTVAQLPTIGWSETSLTAETARLIEEFATHCPGKAIFRLPVTKGQAVRSSSTRKYFCPECGISVRATKEVRIICGECDRQMIEE